MEVRPIVDQKLFESFVASQPHTPFLQSWQWGAFQERSGWSVSRYRMGDGNRLVAAVQVLERALPGEQGYWYIPRGPVVSASLDRDAALAAMREMLTGIRALARPKDVMFIKIEPPLIRDDAPLLARQVLGGLRHAPARYVQPSDTILLPLDKTSHQISEQLHQKTRYNIHLAERKGVTIRQGVSANDLMAFCRLTATTASRDAFVAHDAGYYQTMFELYGFSGALRLFLAEYHGSIIAANIVMHYGDTVTYVHGASANEFRNVMAPHLLQWKQIEYAQSVGARWYDFWGVGSAAAGTQERWEGITRFKQGFGGVPVGYAGTRDLILKPGWYTLYKFIRRFRT
ncbi:MAG: lipid II:glycine glycyltransferase FemX [Patescibacteria group bacterium]